MITTQNKRDTKRKLTKALESFPPFWHIYITVYQRHTSNLRAQEGSQSNVQWGHPCEIKSRKW